MVLNKEELGLGVSVITSTFDARRPLDKAEVQQLANELNRFYEKLKIWTK